MSDTFQFTRIVTKEVVRQEQVTEQAEVPVLDLTKEAVVEVLEGGDGLVFINGILIKGAKWQRAETTFNQWGFSGGQVTLWTPHGGVKLPLTKYICNPTATPQTVAWKAKKLEGRCEGDGTRACCCYEPPIAETPNGYLYCAKHYHPFHR